MDQHMQCKTYESHIYAHTHVHSTLRLTLSMIRVTKF